jgi:hypothetical protein
VVTEAYFETLGVDLLDGRALTRDDLLLDRPVVVLSRGLASAWWPNASALGRRISYGFDEGAGEGEWLEVVGVVDDVRDREIQAPSPAMVYAPLQLRHLPNERWRDLSVVLRSASPLGSAGALRAAVAARDRTIPVYDVRTMEGVLSDVNRRDRTVMALLVVAATLALFLASIGLYGVLSFVVGQRRREIGLRLALGAEPGQVRGLVLRQAGGLVAFGLAGGVAAVALTRRVVEQSLYEIGPSDPGALVGVLLLLGSVAALAAYGPARRASYLSPTITLKEE